MEASLLLVSGETVYLESGIKHLLAYVLVWISGFVGEQITFFLKLLGKFLILLLLVLWWFLGGFRVQECDGFGWRGSLVSSVCGGFGSRP